MSDSSRTFGSESEWTTSTDSEDDEDDLRTMSSDSKLKSDAIPIHHQQQQEAEKNIHQSNESIPVKEEEPIPPKVEEEPLPPVKEEPQKVNTNGGPSKITNVHVKEVKGFMFVGCDFNQPPTLVENSGPPSRSPPPPTQYHQAQRGATSREPSSAENKLIDEFDSFSISSDSKFEIDTKISESKKKLTIDDKYLVAENIGSNWIKMGRFLPEGEFPDSFFEDIRSRHQDGGIPEMAFQVLTVWAQRCPSQATIGQLSKVLLKMKRGDLAQQLTP